MARVILLVCMFLSVWCLCDSKSIARLEESVVHREELTDCVTGDEIQQNVNEVKASVIELNAYIQKSIEGLKEDILHAVRNSVTSYCQTNASTYAPRQSTSMTTSQTPKVPEQSTETTTEVNDQTTIPTATSPVKLQSCLEHYHNGERRSGVYTIYPLPSNQSVQVYCDMDTGGGGWTVFQRRQDGSVNFYRTWVDYASGFGNVSGEFWLGNDLIRSLTGQGPHELRIDMKDYANHSAFANYSTFKVSPSVADFALDVGVSGSPGDPLTHSSGMAFSTWDRDNDGAWQGNCAHGWGGGWWYDNCGHSNLNGLYGQGHGWSGVWWKHKYDPLMWTEMKFRATSHA